MQVPNYAIFEPSTGVLEVYQLDDSGRYQIQDLDENNRCWIREMNLFLGVWSGSRENRTGYWLRWWDESGERLLWGAEMVERERQQRALAQQQAEQERERSERLAAQLRAAGIEPEA